MPPGQRWPLTLLAAAALCAGCGALIAASDLPYPYLHVPAAYRLLGTALTILPCAVIGTTARRARVPDFGAHGLSSFTFAAALLLQWAATLWWPNSADEYGYTFLADTLLHGRLWNPPPPAPLLFDYAWIFTRDGKWFSQYAPGFPALLAPFRAVGAGFLLNPLLGAALAAAMPACLVAIGVAAPLIAPVTVLLVLTPFTLCNAAALFPHMLCALTVTLIILLQAKDEAAPSRRNKAAIGALFSALLLTRYEAFAIVFAVYAASRVLALRHRIVAVMWPAALGAAPGLAAFLAYNALITKRALRTPYAWASTGAGYGFHAIGDRGLNTPLTALLRSLQWATELCAFAGLFAVLLWIAAVFVKARARRWRWYDWLFPATLLFFFFFANTGGHRFGPRYWYFAWPAALCTVATAWPGAGGWIGGRRAQVHAPTAAVMSAAICAGFLAVFAPRFATYVALRRAVYLQTPPRVPAIVLIPSREISLSPHESRPTKLGSADFPRNGTDFTGSVWYARGDDGTDNAAHYERLACSIPGHFVYRATEKTLQPINCSH